MRYEASSVGKEVTPYLKALFHKGADAHQLGASLIDEVHERSNGGTRSCVAERWGRGVRPGYAAR